MDPSSAFRNRLLFSIAIGTFIILDLFIAYSQWCTGTAAEKMVRELELRGYIAATHPGAIESHVGNRFRQSDRENIHFIVVNGSINNAIVITKSDLSFAKRSYSLIRMKE